MTYEELKSNLESEQSSLLEKLTTNADKRKELLAWLDEYQGKIRTGVNCPLTAGASKEENTSAIDDSTYAELQRSLNRQKKILSLYRKQFKKKS